MKFTKVNVIYHPIAILEGFDPNWYTWYSQLLHVSYKVILIILNQHVR